MYLYIFIATLFLIYLIINERRERANKKLIEFIFSLLRSNHFESENENLILNEAKLRKISKIRALKIYENVKEWFIEEKIDELLKEKKIKDEREEELIYTALKLGVIIDKKILSLIKIYRTIDIIESTSQIPTIKLTHEYKIDDGESAYYFEQNVKLREEKRDQNKALLKTTQCGDFILTHKKIYLFGEKKVTKIELEKIVYFKRFADSIKIVKSKGRAIYLFNLNNDFMEFLLKRLI